MNKVVELTPEQKLDGYQYASQLRATDLDGLITFQIEPHATVTDVLREIRHEGSGINKVTMVRLESLKPHRGSDGFFDLPVTHPVKVVLR
jgi:hypothetical protein